MLRVQPTVISLTMTEVKDFNRRRQMRNFLEQEDSNRLQQITIPIRVRPGLSARPGLGAVPLDVRESTSSLELAPTNRSTNIQKGQVPIISLADRSRKIDYSRMIQPEDEAGSPSRQFLPMTPRRNLREGSPPRDSADPESTNSHAELLDIASLDIGPPDEEGRSHRSSRLTRRIVDALQAASGERYWPGTIRREVLIRPVSFHSTLVTLTYKSRLHKRWMEQGQSQMTKRFRALLCVALLLILEAKSVSAV